MLQQEFGPLSTFDSPAVYRIYITVFIATSTWLGSSISMLDMLAETDETSVTGPGLLISTEKHNQKICPTGPSQDINELRLGNNHVPVKEAGMKA